MDAKLVIVGGKANRSQVSVTLPAVIGRSREADLTVAHPMISRKHCELYEASGLVRVRDLGSLNGLFVEGRQVQEAALQPHAEFTVGPLTFRVEYRHECADEIAAAPAASTMDDTVEQPEGRFPGEDAEWEEVNPPSEVDEAQGIAVEEGTLPAEEEPAPERAMPESADAQPAIAPPDGKLPDFSAWEDPQGRAADESENDQVPDPPEEDSARPEPPSGKGPNRPAGKGLEEPELEPRVDRPAGLGSFDLTLPPEPDAGESEQKGAGNNELSRFLKGLD